MLLGYSFSLVIVAAIILLGALMALEIFVFDPAAAKYRRKRAAKLGALKEKAES